MFSLKRVKILAKSILSQFKRKCKL